MVFFFRMVLGMLVMFPLFVLLGFVWIKAGVMLFVRMVLPLFVVLRVPVLFLSALCTCGASGALAAGSLGLLLLISVFHDVNV